MSNNGARTGIGVGPEGIASLAVPDEKMSDLQLQSIVGRMAHYAEYLTSDVEKEIASSEHARFAGALAARGIAEFDMQAAYERINDRLGYPPPVKAVAKRTRARSQ